MVAGTDAGINLTKPHDVLPNALSDFVADGMNPLEGLRVLTAVAAKACGVGRRKGRLAAGFDADLVAVIGDPTREPAALASVLAVWTGGTRIRVSAHH